MIWFSDKLLRTPLCCCPTRWNLAAKWIKSLPTFPRAYILIGWAQINNSTRSPLLSHLIIRLVADSLQLKHCKSMNCQDCKWHCNYWLNTTTAQSGPTAFQYLQRDQTTFIGMVHHFFITNLELQIEVSCVHPIRLTQLRQISRK